MSTVGIGGVSIAGVAASPWNARRISAGVETGMTGGCLVKNCWIKGGNLVRIEELEVELRRSGCVWIARSRRERLAP